MVDFGMAVVYCALFRTRNEQSSSLQETCQQIKTHERSYLLSLSLTRQLSQDIPADAGFLRDKAASLWSAIKDNPYVCLRMCACVHSRM